MVPTVVAFVLGRVSPVLYELTALRHLRNAAEMVRTSDDARTLNIQKKLRLVFYTTAHVKHLEPAAELGRWSLRKNIKRSRSGLSGLSSCQQLSRNYAGSRVVLVIWRPAARY